MMGDVIVIGFMIPIVLIIWCGFGLLERIKNRKVTLEELKDYYWLKNSNGNERIEEKYYSIRNIILEVIYFSMIVVLILAFWYDFDLYNFEPLKILVSSEAFWSILGINIDILTIISLVTVLKKDYYLGINVKDVMRLYAIPNFVMRVLIGSSIIFFFYGIYNIKRIKNSEIYSAIVELMIYTLVIYILFSLMLLLYKTVNICINNSKREMKAFECLRYKILFGYQLDQNEVINSSAVEKISTYLVDKVLKYYKRFVKKADKISSFQYDSAMLLGEKNTDYAQKYNKKFRRGGTVRISCFCVSCEIMLILNQYYLIKEKSNIMYGVILIEILLTAGVIIFGAVKNIWNTVVVNRSFWIFNYENQSKEEIAAAGFCRKYNKKYEFVGAIEDLICFYKILVYNYQGEGVRDILIEKVKQKINKSEDSQIRDAILLLCYYFDYEKCYLECEQKMRKERKGKDNVEKIKEKTIKKIKRKNVYDYQEMKIWMKDIEQESVEYQLADSILKHVYKEPEMKKDGTMNPEKLKNYKFEYYFDFIKNKVDKA